MATTSTLPTRTRTEKGLSLARGPALILGTILEVAGLYFLYKQHTFPPLSNFPNGSAPVPGKVFFGIFGVNGWSGMLTAAAGGLLLFGAAQHLLAKTMSLIVGVALGAAAVIAVVSGNVLGLAAANGWTRLGWGVCAVILLFNTLVPRRTRTIEEPDAAARPVARNRLARPVRSPEPPRDRNRDSESPTRVQAAETEPLVTRDQAARVADPDDAVAPNGHADGGQTADDSEAVTRVERTGPMDDREAADEPAGEGTRELPGE